MVETEVVSGDVEVSAGETVVETAEVMEVETVEAMEVDIKWEEGQCPY